MRHEEVRELLAIWETDAEKITWETPKVGVCCGDRAKGIRDSLGVWLCSGTKSILLSRVKQVLICCPSVFPSPAERLSAHASASAARRGSQRDPRSHTRCGVALEQGIPIAGPWPCVSVLPQAPQRTSRDVTSIGGSRAADSAELAGTGSSSPSGGTRAEPDLGDETG